MAIIIIFREKQLKIVNSSSPSLPSNLIPTIYLTGSMNYDNYAVEWKT